MYIPAKRVSGPLDDKVKARLRGDGMSTPAGYASSGSDHDAAEPPLFSGPIHAFLDIDHHDDIHADVPTVEQLVRVSDDVNEDAGDVGRGHDAVGEETVRELLDPSRRSDPFLVGLHRDVMTAMAAASGGTTRSVMARLRGRGYNAGVCKARWESSGSSLSAGSYEYIDVVVDDKERESRYIVDIEFAAEFEVARATGEYTELVAALPRVMVGRGEEVKQVVRIMAEAAWRSMKSRDLSLPPWRKRRYMLAKWFGPYRRTTNVLPSSTTGLPMVVAPEAGIGETIKCRRAVGFAVGASERIFLPWATGTR